MEWNGWVIDFFLDARSRVAPYAQIADQVRQALRLGLLEPGDQLPTVRAVVAQVAINPNTVLKAYRELEMEGIVAGRPGQGTFVLRTLAGADLADQDRLRHDLAAWLRSARAAGLDDDAVRALFNAVLRQSPEQESA